jgi:hypothetical protein
LELTLLFFHAAAENAKKKEMIASANYTSANLARQLDFATAAHCDEKFVDDRKPAGENTKEKIILKSKNISTHQYFHCS